MYDMMKKQNLGVEIELTGITRQKAAKIISTYFGGTDVNHIYDGYDTWTARDRQNRIWKCSRDISITPEAKVRGEIQPRPTGRTSTDLRCEIVTPILRYEDIEDLQNIVRALRKGGAFANSSCGIHVHVDGANHTPDSLTRLLNFAVGRQDLFYEALQIGANRSGRWCKKVNPAVFKAMKKTEGLSRSQTESIWYSRLNDGYSGGVSRNHYNDTRYHGINLHAFFTKGTVEFRLFNGTTHAGKIKAYIQFCLAMSAWAIACPDNNLYFRSTANMTAEQKGKLMMSVLTNRLGLTGQEFKTCREHLTAAFATSESAVA